MIATSKSAEVLWLLADQQGSIRDVVDDSGVLRKHVEYSAAGKIASETWYGQSGQQVVPTHAEAVDQLFYYTGLARDSKTGFLRADQRDYDPQTGRWTSEDPIGFADGPNPFTAFGNSFPNATDPTGLSQAGNPLNNLFGGYSGGVVQPQKVIPTVRYDAPFALAPNAGQIARASLPAANPFAGPIRPTITSSALPLNIGPSLDLIDTRSFTASAPHYTSVDPIRGLDFKLQPQREIASVTPIGGRSLGDMVYGNLVGELNQAAKLADSPGNAFSAKLAGTIHGLFKGALDAIGPAPTPSQLVKYNDGSQLYRLNGELSTGGYASQALALAPVVFKGVPLQTGPAQTPVATSTIGIEQGRDALGRFLPKTPGQLRPGSLAEQATFDAVRQKPGWQVTPGRVYATDATGQVRVYDGVATSPSGRVIGIETKSGTGRLTSAQRAFDTRLNSSRGNTASGIGGNAGLTIQRAIEVRR